MPDNRSRLAKLTHPNPEITMGDESWLPELPAKPTLIDYLKLRCDTVDHLLQSARLAQNNGCSETVIMACLLHDISVCSYIRGDHGYHGESLVSPYVTKEISWSVRVHQALRFFPDANFGYGYPQAYIDWFGEDYKPDDYIKYEYEQALKSPYYETARLICCFDLYSFDPNITVNIEDFTDIIGRNFKQPEEGLGWDNTSASHIWRTIRRPNKFL